MMNTKLFRYISCALALSILMMVNVNAQNAQPNPAALAMADTSAFSVNKAGNWLLYNSFIEAKGSDSVRLELILSHENPVNWSEEVYVGKIRQQSFYPLSTQVMTYQLLFSHWELRIDKQGRCYLKKLDGILPEDAYFTIPLTITYKKN